MMNERTKMHVRKYEHVSFGLLWVHMKGGVHRMVIVACYVPVNHNNGRIRDEFRGKLCNTERM